MRLTLPNGLVLEGLPKVVAEAAQELGHNPEDTGEYYVSESLGLISVRLMTTAHLKNALIKKWVAWIESCRYLPPKKFVEVSTNPEKLIHGMLEELTRR